MPRLTAALALALLGACAPHQRVALHSEPSAATVYLDGKAVDITPTQIRVRADHDHSLLFKHPGHVPQLVILQTRHEDGSPRLEPPEVRVKLQPLAPGGKLDIQLEGSEPDSETPLDPEWNPPASPE